jgi:hypothetical protein
MTESQIIDRLGGTTEVAKLCEVTKGAVSQWRTNGIPKAQRNYLRLLRPDVFDDQPISAAHDGQEAA